MNVPILDKKIKRDDLKDLFRNNNYKIGVEVGVHKGKHTQKICEANPDLLLYCVDIWEPFTEVVRGKECPLSWEQQAAYYKEAQNRLASYNTKIMKMPSKDAVKNFDDNSIDFVYIDAAHSYENVQHDLREWVKKIKPGGMICGHDYDRDWGVKQAVDEYVAEHHIPNCYYSQEHSPSFWWYKFPKTISCIPFFKDHDILEVHLSSLAPYVEQFVIMEGPLTFGNEPKPFYFFEQKERYDKFNIKYLQYEPHKNYAQMNGMSRGWDHLQWMVNHLDVSPETMILLSDGDEIPDLRVWNGQEGVFRMERYYYRFNGYYQNNNWYGTDAILKSTLNKHHIKRIRYHRGKYSYLWKKNVFDGGWHFSCLGDIEDIIYKYKSNAHQELNNDEVFQQVRENYNNKRHPLHNALRNIYGRAHVRKGQLVEKMPSGPEWLLQNKDKYKHLLYG